MEFKDTKNQSTEQEFEEKTIKINRVAKVLKGGRRFRFNALVAVGDKIGRVGLGFGKALEVPDAINKAKANAKKNIINVPLVKETIPHEVIGKCGASVVMLKPAGPGTGIIAGSTVRAIVEVAGIKNILTKSIGSNTAVNLSKATMNALQQLVSVETRMNLRKGKKS